jgi:hypothetical protein
MIFKYHRGVRKGDMEMAEMMGIKKNLLYLLYLLYPPIPLPYTKGFIVGETYR